MRLPALLLAIAGLTSCATKEKPSAISTANTADSSLPWNQQEKWENEGQMGPMAERFEEGGNHR